MENIDIWYSCIECTYTNEGDYSIVKDEYINKYKIKSINNMNKLIEDIDSNNIQLKIKLNNFDENTIMKFTNKMALQGIEVGGDALNDFIRNYELFKTSDYMRNNEPDVYKLVMMVGNKIKILKEEGSDVLTHKRLMEFTSINKEGGFWFGSNRLYIKSFEGGLINEIEIYDNESVLFHLKSKTIETLHPLYSGLCRNTNDLKYIIEKYM